MGKRVTGAGGGQGLIAKIGEHLRRAGIPRIGDDEDPLAIMQGLEGLGFEELLLTDLDVHRRAPGQKKPASEQAKLLGGGFSV